jgi:hypothetical protein
VTFGTFERFWDREDVVGRRGAMIVKVKGGYRVVSGTTGRNLGGLYKTKEEAVKRLRQVEFFKRKKK